MKECKVFGQQIGSYSDTDKTGKPVSMFIYALTAASDPEFFAAYKASKGSNYKETPDGVPMYWTSYPPVTVYSGLFRAGHSAKDGSLYVIADNDDARNEDALIGACSGAVQAAMAQAVAARRLAAMEAARNAVAPAGFHPCPALAAAPSSAQDTNTLNDM